MDRSIRHPRRSLDYARDDKEERARDDKEERARDDKHQVINLIT
jgi:hypothetical protein